MEQFKIHLKNAKIRWYRSIAIIGLIVNVAMFLYLIFYDQYRISVIINLIMLIFYFAARNYEVKKKRKGYVLNEWLYFLLAFCWLGIQNYWLMGICFVMGLLFFLALQNVQMHFSKAGVQKLNFPQKFFKWSLFDNVILKDDILTLDFKTNRIMQAEVEANLQDVNESDFNAFADKQIQDSTFNNN